jgi:hypothetical protein
MSHSSHPYPGTVVLPSEYEHHSITIDPLLIGFPPLRSRAVRDEHVQKLQDIFRERGFQSATSMITVMAANEDTDLVADDRRCEHVVVDGMHRLTALQELRKCQEPDVAVRFIEVPVNVLRKKDRSAMTPMDLLKLAWSFNETTHLVASKNFDDELVMCNSFVHASQYEFGHKGVFDPRNPKRQVSAEVATLLSSAALLDSSSDFQTARRYLISTGAFAVAPKAWERLRLLNRVLDDKRMFTAHIFCCRDFGNQSELHKTIMVEAVFERFVFMEKEGIRKIHVNSPKALFGDVAVILDHISDHCDRSGLDEEIFLQNTVGITAFAATGGMPAHVPSVPAVTMITPLFAWIPTLFRTWEDTNRKNANTMEQQMDGIITMFNIYASRLHSELQIPARRPPLHPSTRNRTGTLPTDSIQGDKDTGQVAIAGPSNRKSIEPSRYSSSSRNRSDFPDSSVPPSPVCSTPTAQMESSTSAQHLASNEILPSPERSDFLLPAAAGNAEARLPSISANARSADASEKNEAQAARTLRDMSSSRLPNVLSRKASIPSSSGNQISRNSAERSSSTATPGRHQSARQNEKSTRGSRKRLFSSPPGSPVRRTRRVNIDREYNESEEQFAAEIDGRGRTENQGNQSTEESQPPRVLRNRSGSKRCGSSQSIGNQLENTRSSSSSGSKELSPTHIPPEETPPDHDEREHNEDVTFTRRTISQDEGDEDVQKSGYQSQESADVDELDEYETFFDDIQANPLPAFSQLTSRQLPRAIHPESRTKYYVGKATLSLMESDIRYRAASLCGPILHEEKDGSNPDETPGSFFIDPRFTVCMEIVRCTEYFSREGQALREKGYCILPGIFVAETKKQLDELVAHFMNRFSGLGSPREQDDPWSKIYNTGEQVDEDSDARTPGRYTTPREWFCDKLEVARNSFYMRKQHVEAYLALLVEFLGLHPDQKERRTDTGLFFPRTGARLLMTTEGCPRQKPHIDFSELPRTTKPCSLRDLPSYFLIASAADPFKICIWPYTHVMMNCSPQVQRDLSKSWPMTVVEVPPYSVLVVRGDLVHAGAAASDDPERNQPDRTYMHNVRLHIYLVRECESLLDAVHLPSNYMFAE